MDIWVKVIGGTFSNKSRVPAGNLYGCLAETGLWPVDVRLIAAATPPPPRNCHKNHLVFTAFRKFFAGLLGPFTGLTGLFFIYFLAKSRGLTRKFSINFDEFSLVIMGEPATRPPKCGKRNKSNAYFRCRSPFFYKRKPLSGGLKIRRRRL
jgi:hypothetical protein